MLTYQALALRQVKPNVCLTLPHRRSTQLSLETNPLPTSNIVRCARFITQHVGPTVVAVIGRQ